MTNILSREKRPSLGIEGGMVYILKDNAGNRVHAVMGDPNKPEAAVLVYRDERVVLDLHCRGTEWAYDDGRWSALEKLIAEAADETIERHFLVLEADGYGDDSPLGRSWGDHVALECTAYTAHNRYSWMWAKNVTAESRNYGGWDELAAGLGLVPEYTVPIFMYDHGSQAFSTRINGGGTVNGWWQHWQWDAGQIGFLSATQQQVHEWCNTRHAALFAEESVVTGCTADDVRAELALQVRRLNDWANGERYRVGLALLRVDVTGTPEDFLGWVTPDLGCNGQYTADDIAVGRDEVDEALDRAGALEGQAWVWSEYEGFNEW